ncbi:MAG: LacI family transcriptional regulator, partial [Lentisphaerae bacterium]
SLTTEAGEKAATEFLCCASPVSAIFTAGGYPALGVMRTAQRLGLKIPDELSLIARTAYSISELAVPPLTICGLPQRSWIREAASLLIQRIRSGNETHSPRSHVVPIGGVMIRGTTRRVHNRSHNQETSQ